MKLAMAGTKIENVTFYKKRLHFIHKDAKILKENMNELHFCNSEAYTEIS